MTDRAARDHGLPRIFNKTKHRLSPQTVWGCGPGFNCPMGETGLHTYIVGEERRGAKKASFGLGA